MLCHRCGSEVQDGAKTCDNCGAALGRRSFSRTLTAFRALEERSKSADDDLPARPGDLIGQRFVLDDVIGRGPLGAVFAARDRTNPVDVAVRIIDPTLLTTQSDIDHALTVLERARRLAHDNIVRVYEVGRDLDRLYIVSERLEGLTLAKVLDLRRDKHQPFGVAEATPIVERITTALLHAHRHLPHGDLSPENVQLLPTALKLTDFGLAAAIPGDRFVAAHRATDQLGRLAPELRDGEPPTARADIYGLGALVYALLAGRPHAPGAPTIAAALGRIEDGPHPLDRLVARATAIDPADRYENVEAFADAFATAIDTAPPPGDHEATRRVSASAARRPGTDDAAEVADDAPTREALPASDEPARAPSADARPSDQTRSSGAPPALPQSSPPRLSPPPSSPPPSSPPHARGSAPPPPPIDDRAGAPVPARRSAGLPAGRIHIDGPAEPVAHPGRGGVPGTTPSVLFDPAVLTDLEIPPPPVGPGPDDRTPTRPIRPIPDRRPWYLSNIGFVLTIALIVGSAAAITLYWLGRGDETAPQIVTRAAPPLQPPAPVVVEPTTPTVAVVTPTPDAPTPVAAPSPTPDPAARPAPASPPAPAAPREAPSPAPPRAAEPAPARQDPPQPPAAPVSERTTDTRERAAPPAAIAPSTPPERVAEPPPPEPEPAPVEPAPVEPTPAESAPAEPAALSCPAGMRLLTRGLPRGAVKKGKIHGADAIALAREGKAYCIDAHEFPGAGRPPRTSVTFEAARGACEVAGKRLCTDAEWRRACAGRRGAAYPYGGAFDAGRCNTEDADGEERAVSASGSFKRCRSASGAYDMSGNVAEWTADQTVRGGDFASADDDASCGAGGKRSPSSARPSIGFRCCADFSAD